MLPKVPNEELKRKLIRLSEVKAKRLKDAKALFSFEK